MSAADEKRQFPQNARWVLFLIVQKYINRKKKEIITNTGLNEDLWLPRGQKVYSLTTFYIIL